MSHRRVRIRPNAALTLESAQLIAETLVELGALGESGDFTSPRLSGLCS